MPCSKFKLFLQGTVCIYLGSCMSDRKKLSDISKTNNICLKEHPYTEQKHHKDPTVRVIHLWILKIIGVITKFCLILIQRMLLFIDHFAMGHFS